MKNKKQIFFVLIPLLIAVFVINIPIFEVKNNLPEVVDGFESDENVCVVKCAYNTGAKWQVVYDNHNNLLNECIILSDTFAPCLLRANKDFDLDYMAQYVVSVNKIDKMMIDNEEVNVIYPNDVIIVYDTDKDCYRIKDLCMVGVVKSLMGIFNEKYRYC